MNSLLDLRKYLHVYTEHRPLSEQGDQMVHRGRQLWVKWKNWMWWKGYMSPQRGRTEPWYLLGTVRPYVVET